MKKVVLFLISFLLLINNVKAINLDINSKYAYCYNLTEDKIMYEKNAYDEIKVASLTKIMTAIIVIENNKNLNEKITVLDEDLRDMYEYTTTGFQDGDVVTIKDLLYGVLLASGSDAVNAAVRITTTTEEEFISLMNQKVKELNLTHTYFSNPIGKDEDNYSSMSDMAKILEYCLKNATFKEIISTDTYIVEPLNLQINGPTYNSLNKYNVDTSVVSGAKSGYTTQSRFSFVSYSEMNNIEYIVVTSYSDSYKKSLMDTSNIYNYFYNNYSYFDYNIDFNIDIKNGKDKYYNINLNTKLYLENNYDSKLITYKYNGKDEINILTKKGNKLGSVSIYYDKELIDVVDVKLEKDIEYKTKAYFKISTFVVGFIIVIVLLFILKCLKKRKKKYKKKKVKTKIKVEKIAPINKPKQVIKSINVEKIIKEEESIEKKLHILKTTVNINLFFDKLKSIDNKVDKENLEHSFIDRCFENIDFTNIESLKDLYTKLKLYKNDMSTNTVTYYNKLFKYCISKYVDKK